MNSEPTPKDDLRPPTKILIPVSTLTVPRAWRVGRVTFVPSDDARRLMAEIPPFESKGDVIANGVQEVLDSSGDGCLAEIQNASDIDEAVEALRSSLSVLRLFQATRRSWKETTFGVGTDAPREVITYIAVWERSASGATVEGHYTGYTFNDEALDDWRNSEAFQYLSNALSNPTDEGQLRAIRGALLFDRAALELNPDLRMLGFASALEAWIHGNQRGPKKYRLARHVAWFTCGAHDGDLCGRARPICPYLHLKPSDHTRLDVLRWLGNSYSLWRCTEWHRVVDWYEARNAVAHGGLKEVTKQEADRAAFWIAHDLATPMLLWLRDHPNDPVGELQRLLESQPDPAGWSAMCSAIDAESPPDRPPEV